MRRRAFGSCILVLGLLTTSCGDTSEKVPELQQQTEQTTTATTSSTTAAPTTTISTTTSTTAAPTTTISTTTSTTAAPTTTISTTTVGPVPLEWPKDIGISHFGHVSAGWDSGPGGWRRAHPGVFAWGLVETEPGRYNWQTTDEIVAAMQQDRVAVLTTLWPFAEWDQATCHSEQPKAQPVFPELGDLLYAPCDLVAYSDWLAATVERYDGDGINDMPGLEYPIRHWEIANEPEMQGPELTFFQGDSTAYLELLRSSYKTIKAADPLAVVLLGGQAGMFDSMKDYWKPVLEGAHGFFDVGNIHSISSSDTFFSREYRDFLNRLDHEVKPFWVTEAEIGKGRGQNQSEEELAQIAFTGSVTSFVNGAEVVIIAGAAYDHPRVSEKVREAWEVAVTTIGDFETVFSLSESSARFDMPDGVTIYAIWDGAGLPDEVTGVVLTRRYDGVEDHLEASEVVSELPTFVLVATPVTTTTLTGNSIPPTGAGSMADLSQDIRTLTPATYTPSTETTYKVTTTDNLLFGSGGTSGGGSKDLLLNLCLPDTAGTGPRPLLLHLHGGGFTGGKRSSCALPDHPGSGGRNEARTLLTAAEQGWVVASIDYRLAGDDPAPGLSVTAFLDAIGGSQAPAPHRSLVAAVEDTLTALNYLLGRADELNIDTDRIVLRGESAGSFTALAVAYCADKFDIERPSIAAVVGYAGALTQSCEHGSTIDPNEAPLFIAHGTEDRGSTAFSNAEDIAQAAAKVGLVFEFHALPGLGHGWNEWAETTDDGRPVGVAMFEFLDRVLYSNVQDETAANNEEVDLEAGSSMDASSTIFSESPTVTYETGGDQPEAFVCSPEGTGPFPAIVYAHGRLADLYGDANPGTLGSDLSGICQTFSAQGYVLVAPIRQSRDGDLSGHQKEVDDAIEYVRSRGDIDPARISLIGYSRGGFLALRVGIERQDLEMLAIMSPASEGERFTRAMNPVASISASVFLVSDATEDAETLENVNLLEQALIKHKKDYKTVLLNPVNGNAQLWMAGDWIDEYLEFLTSKRRNL